MLSHSSSDDHERLLLALEAAGLDLWENDLVAGKATHPASRTFLELGYAPEELGDTLAFWLEILHPEDRPAIENGLIAYRNGRSDNYRAEFRLRSKSGEWIWYANYGKVMRGSVETGMNRFIGVTFNINERKHREEELSRINRLLLAQNQQLDQMNAHLETLSSTDPLTGLFNRRAMNECLHRLIRSAGCEAGLLFVDLDDFKTTNDIYGHDVGDILLCQVAQRLQSCVQSGDMIARFGGDEFVLLVHGDKDSGGLKPKLETVCERILNILGQPYVVGDLLLNACGSIGVACYPAHGTTVETLTKRADIALYRAKRQGRSLYRFFDSGMELDLYNRDHLEKALRSALKTRQLEMRFQLQVDRGMRPIGAEALLRWHHPERGLIGAMEFLPEAVASGLVHDIDNLVLENACATLGKWQHDPELARLSLSVNITARAFDSPSIASGILAMLDRFGVPPGRLCLEITEQLETRSFVTANTAITRLRERGVRIALDDCGTGFSSLESLKSLSFDQVKIDGVFIRDIGSNPVSQAIVAGLIAICRAMGLQVLAECVESPDQMEYLLEAGVDCFQGYLFGMPLPCAILEAAVRDAPAPHPCS